MRINAHPGLLLLDMSGVTMVDRSGAQMIRALSDRLLPRGTAVVVIHAAAGVRSGLLGCVAVAADAGDARRCL